MRRPGPNPIIVWTTAFTLGWIATSGCTGPSRRRRQRAFEARQVKIDAKEEGGWRRRDKPRLTTPDIRSFTALGETVGARPIPIASPCLNALCTRRALGRLFNKLDRVDEDRQGVARILLLGDSHIAADYIARTIRERLQRRFGNAGRGFVAIDQHALYGGRRRSKSYWARTRIVDGDGPGQAFGFAGMRLDSLRPGAKLVFELEPYDDDVVTYFLGQPRGPLLTFYVGGETVGRLRTEASRPSSRVLRLPMPEHAANSDEPPRRLKIVARGPRATLFGLSFESYEAGVILDAIGPVGADAHAYLQMEASSFQQHLRALDPDLVMLMIGGNDALAIRRGDRTVEQVANAHVELVRFLKSTLPDADCLLWAPLDAGVRKDGRIESKSHLVEVRDLQLDVAKDLQCAFWDTYEAMGGAGSFGRWFDEGLMNSDLVHPRSKGGDLLGHLFATAFMDAYLNGS